jgi:hypothetical protein
MASSDHQPPGSRVVKFYLKWRHRDGSIIEFSPAGWTSDDPLKSDWLKKMSQLSGSGPPIPAVIRNWLRAQCELIAFGEPEYLKPPSSHISLAARRPP